MLDCLIFESRKIVDKIRCMSQSFKATSPVEVLQSYFGYESFRGPQAAIVDRVLSDRHTMVVMPTGGENRFVIRFLQ